MDIILVWEYFVVVILGVMLGSFLNVLIIRIHEETPWWEGRSRCPVCKKELEWYELLPVVSFMIQRGECRNCKTPISWQYPLIEIMAGLTAAGVLYKFGFSLENLLIFLILYLLIGGFTSDLKFMEIPELFTLGGIVLAIVYAIFFSNISILNIVIGGAVGFLFFFIQYLATKGNGLGEADIKLGLSMGIFLGWPNIIVMILLSYIVASVILLPLIAMKKLNMKSAVPLGVFLIPTFIIFVFFQQDLAILIQPYFAFTALIR